MIRNGIFNGVANHIDSLIDQLGDEIEEEQQEDDEAGNEDLMFTQKAEMTPEKEGRFERMKLSVQESIEATEKLMSSESLPKELTGEDAAWQPPQYEMASMPRYSTDQLERICQVELDLSQFNCDSTFLGKAFQLEAVELQLETVRECDLNRSTFSVRKKRKKSHHLTKSGKKAAARGTTERLTDNLLTNYLVKQETERAIPCLLYTSPSPRDKRQSRMPSSA